MHFYTFGGHYEYLKVIEVINLTFINVPSITLAAQRQYRETPSHQKMVPIYTKLVILPAKNDFSSAVKGLMRTSIRRYCWLYVKYMIYFVFGGEILNKI